MDRLNEGGMSLIEVLVASVILSLVVTGVMAALFAQTDANTHVAQRLGATAAAEQVLESFRLEDPALLPGSGSAAAQQITVGDRQYEVVAHFCLRSELCGGESRHLTVEVFFQGESIYDVETVFTRVR